MPHAATDRIASRPDPKQPVTLPLPKGGASSLTERVYGLLRSEILTCAQDPGP